MSDFYRQFYHAEKSFPSHEFDWRLAPHEKSLRIVSPLEVDGVIQEGFRFHGKTLIDTPDRNVTFVLSYTDARSSDKGVTIAKAEWEPISSHNNKGLGPQEFRHRIQTCSHVHCFDDNVILKGDIWLKRKLPVALPIEPPPQTFRDFLEFVGERFKIPNIWLVQEPPWKREWQRDLI